MAVGPQAAKLSDTNRLLGSGQTVSPTGQTVVHMVPNTAEDPATYDDAEFGLHLKQEMGPFDGIWNPRSSDIKGGPTWSMLSVNNVSCGKKWGDKKGPTHHGSMLYDAKLHNRSARGTGDK